MIHELYVLDWIRSVVVIPYDRRKTSTRNTPSFSNLLNKFLCFDISPLSFRPYFLGQDGLRSRSRTVECLSGIEVNNGLEGDLQNFNQYNKETLCRPTTRGTLFHT